MTSVVVLLCEAPGRAAIKDESHCKVKEVSVYAQRSKTSLIWLLKIPSPFTVRVELDSYPINSVSTHGLNHLSDL